VLPEPSGDYEPVGEVQFSGGLSASFSAVSVRSPRMSLGKRSDGSWSGTFQNQPFDVSVTENAVRGVGVTLALNANGPQGFEVEGQWQGRRVRYALKPDTVAIRTHSASFDLTRVGNSAVGSAGDLELKGEANELPAPWPQTAFVLLAVFN
jgi:hypothetical protein